MEILEQLDWHWQHGSSTDQFNGNLTRSPEIRTISSFLGLKRDSRELLAQRILRGATIPISSESQNHFLISMSERETFRCWWGAA